VILPEEKRRGISLSVKESETSLVVFARIDDYKRTLELANLKRADLANVSFRSEALAFHHNRSLIVVDVKLPFDLDVVTASHAAREATEPWARADDPVRGYEWGPFVGGDIPGTGHRCEEQDCESVFRDSIRRWRRGILY
jgi:hypothetical protein